MSRRVSPATIEITGLDQHHAWQVGVLPPVEKLEGGVWSIPVPIPDNPLRYVLVYGLELDSGIALIDTGWDTEEAWTALTDGLSSAGFAVGDVRAVLISHIHPDHYGLAGRVRAASGAWIGLHREDARLLPGRYRDMRSLVTELEAMLRECGVPDSELPELAGASLDLMSLVNFAEPDRLLEDGDELLLDRRRIRVVWTPGHSPGHVCFVDAASSLFFTGDHVLPRISPVVAVHPQQRPNPLADFLDSLVKMRRLEQEIGIREVLPAHEYRFRQLTVRLEQLAMHHEERLIEVAGILAGQPGLTCWEVAQQMTWSRPWSQIAPFMRRAANGEALAHLVMLDHRGQAWGAGISPRRWYPTE